MKKPVNWHPLRPHGMLETASIVKLPKVVDAAVGKAIELQEVVRQLFAKTHK